MKPGEEDPSQHPHPILDQPNEGGRDHGRLVIAHTESFQNGTEGQGIGDRRGERLNRIPNELSRQ